MSQCRSCGQKIGWVKSIRGKNIPVESEYYDYDECEPGTVLVTDGGNVITVKDGEGRPSIKGRLCHFATCPNAEQHRKPQNQGAARRQSR